MKRNALVALAALGLSGCGGRGGGAAAPASAPAPDPARTDQTEVVNQRIRSAAASSRATVRAVGTDYRLGPDDVVDVEVFGAEDFSGSYRVDQTGRISIPLLGAVAVSGQSTHELADSLEAKLAATYMRDPHVTVSVSEMESHGVSVLGAVNAPGVYQVPGRSTLLEVLAEAQGLSEQAGSRVFVVRGGRAATGPDPSGVPPAATSEGLDPASIGEVVEVDLGSMLESGRADANVVVHAGDIVQVLPAGLVYVVGEVNRPGGFTVPPGRPVGVLQALAMAEGMTDMADADSGVIVRELDDGTRMEIEVNLEAVLAGSGDAPALQTRDVLFVPKNGTKSIALGVVSSLVRMVTFRGLVY